MSKQQKNASRLDAEARGNGQDGRRALAGEIIPQGPPAVKTRRVFRSRIQEVLPDPEEGVDVRDVNPDALTPAIRSAGRPPYFNALARIADRA